MMAGGLRKEEIKRDNLKRFMKRIITTASQYQDPRLVLDDATSDALIHVAYASTMDYWDRASKYG
jgi:hypothetical protein